MVGLAGADGRAPLSQALQADVPTPPVVRLRPDPDCDSPLAGTVRGRRPPRIVAAESRRRSGRDPPTVTDPVTVGLAAARTADAALARMTDHHP
ncbi:hypothetical protein [Streptomyces sp. NBC_00827]|uniref:hypothetical protein n=1 Tax=Streptomyces sp. NBC_00827 TaxID=2903677 RepID=UPI0038709BB0|nr:hypothetical protein OG569_01515 [Streptomyces sp. NBC_00827]